MNNYVKKIFYPLVRKDFKKISLILFLSVLSAFFEILGLGLIIPILNIFSGSEYVNYSNYFPLLKNFDQEEILKFILFMFVILYLIKLFVNLYLIDIQNKFSNNLHANLAKKFFKNYLNKNYLFHIKNNSSTLIRNTNQETHLYAFGVVYPLITLISEIIIFTSIIIILFFYDTKATLFSLIFFTFIGLLINQYTKNKLKNFGIKRQIHSAKNLQQLQQGFFSFREILINGFKNSIINKFKYHILKLADINRRRDTLTQIPKFILEFMGVFGFVILFLYLMFIGYEISNIFVLVGLFFFASVRLLPSISKIIKATQSLIFNLPALNLIFEELIKTDLANNRNFNKKDGFQFDNLFDFNKMNFVDVSFKYPNKKNYIIDKLNLSLSKGDKLGIMGQTGSGKSTFLNLFCGLLNPINGKILINDKNINEINMLWQKQIGYVPQTVSIFDETILFNITHEDDKNLIDFERLNKILKLVELDEVVNNLENKLFEIVGEYGSKLSGGQCQRLGIARALYKNPNILILDEATSALDENTENKILKRLFSEFKNSLILMISHKKKSLNFCNKILMIEDSSYKEILN